MTLKNLLSNQLNMTKFKKSSFKDYLNRRFFDYIKDREFLTLEDNKKGNIVGNEDSIKIGRSINFTKIEDLSKKNELEALREKMLNEIQIEKDKFNTVRKDILDSHGRGDLGLNAARDQMHNIEVELTNITSTIRKKYPNVELKTTAEW